MIRLLKEQDISPALSRQGDWQLFRIQALLRAYGTKYDFCRFYQQEESGALLSVLDQSGILAAGEEADLSEWRDYIRAAGIQELSVIDKAGEYFAQESGEIPTTGAIMEYCGEAPVVSESLRQATTMAELKQVYGILCDSFEMGEFAPWYCDISHRLRQGNAYMYWLEEQGCTFVTADADRLFLSAVAVSPEQRGQGVGSRLLRAILSEHRGKTAAVYSRNINADRFYRHLGFRQVGIWRSVCTDRQVAAG